ncbi:hypothetical protein HDV05_006240, partial [Chytridiales sp. JEL 0842]
MYVANTCWKDDVSITSMEYGVAAELEADTRTNQLIFRLAYRRDVISGLHAELLLKQWEALLLDIVRKPASPPCREIISSLNAEELLAVTNLYPRSIEPPPRISHLHSWVEVWATTSPDQPALQFAESFSENRPASPTIWSYAALNSRSNKIAHMLSSLGLTIEDRVVVCMSKNPDFYATVLGVSKAGCCYVPLDASSPVERISHIVRDTQAKLLVLSTRDGAYGELLKTLPQNVKYVFLEKIGLSGFPSGNPDLSINSSSLAYLLYTSGTSGAPKGCLIEHQNVVQSILAFQSLIPVSQKSRFLQFASPAFDVSIFEMLLCWSAGGCLCSTPKDVALRDLELVLNSFQVSHVDLTPSVASLVERKNLPFLKVLVSGGEGITHQIIRDWGDGQSLVNAYGPSEVTIGCSMLVGMSSSHSPQNIGKLFSNCSGVIASPDGKPLLKGAIGELLVGGHLVGRGYLNRPELTSEKFIDWSLPGQPKQLMYRTGDLARMLADGTLELLGRKDSQVKIRGIRIELEEISRVFVDSHSNVTSACAIPYKAFESDLKPTQLACFIVIDGTSSPSDVVDELLILPRTPKLQSIIEIVESRARRQLPSYMMPALVLPVTYIPLGTTGKTNTAKLLELLYQTRRLQNADKSSLHDISDSWSPLEARIRDEIAAVLHIPCTQVAKNSNIFELGVDSLNATQLVRKLRKHQINLEVSDLMLNPMISDIAAVALARTDEHDIANADLTESFRNLCDELKHCLVCDTNGSQLVKAYPCTSMQEGLIFQTLNSEGHVYFNPFYFKLNDNVCVDKVISAWNSTLAAHDILRTHFSIVPGADRLAQYVTSPAEDLISVHSVDDQDIHEFIQSLKYPVSIEIACSDNNDITIAIAAKGSRIPKSHVETMVDQFNAELCGLVKNLDKMAIGCCSDPKLNSELFAFANICPPEISAPYPLLHNYLEFSTANDPHSAALEWVDSIAPSGVVDSIVWTFDELNKKANRLAHCLLAKKCNETSQIVVPICMEKAPQIYIAMLGILKAGFAYMPIDPQLPLQRKLFMISDVGAKVLLTTSDANPQPADCDVIFMDGLESFADFPDSNPNVSKDPNSLAYILSTSGTTGTPKGVMINLANTAFDVSLYEMWIPWSLGLMLTSARSAVILQNIEQAVTALKITHLGLTPTLASLVRKPNMPTVKTLLVGGEALPQCVVEEWSEKAGCLFNCYGPSEVTVNCLVNTDIPRHAKATIIGRQLSTCSIYVVSQNLHPVLKGAVGELCVGGPQVSPGYWQRPELTVKKFPTINYGFGEERLFRTGDLVRMLPDGQIDFIGRIDDQVKRNGLRIELGDINATLAAAHTDILDVSTLLLQRPEQGTAQLVSFVVLKSDHALAKEPDVKLIDISHPLAKDISLSVSNACALLPPYMIPSLVFIVTRMPINASGKLDRKKLAQLFLDSSVLAIGSAADKVEEVAWSELQKKLRRLIAEFANVPESIVTQE